ncbi:MAG: hypothetical protein AAF346_12840 [Pseudomonadota bacterium]
MRPDEVVVHSEFSQRPQLLLDMISPSRGSFLSSVLAGVIAYTEELACHCAFDQLECAAALIAKTYQ